MPRHLLRALAAVALLATAACSSDESSGDEARTAPTTTTTRRPPTVKTIARIDAQDVSFIDLFGERVTWTSAATLGQLHDRAMVHDLRTGKTTIAAKADRNTAIEWSRGSRDTLVFTEQGYEGTGAESTPTGSWRVVMLDLVSGKRQVLDQSRGASDQMENATVEIDWPWVVWIRPSTSAEHFDLVALNVETGKRATAAANVDVSSLHVVDNAAVYVATSAQGSDLFAVDLPDGAARQLTTSGQVSRAGKAGGDQIGYEEPLSGDPTRLLVVPVKGGRPIEVRGERTAGNIVTGAGFAMWFSGTGTAVELSAIAEHAPAATVLPKSYSVAARLSADGNRAAWGERTGDINDIWSATLYVAEVT